MKFIVGILLCLALPIVAQNPLSSLEENKSLERTIAGTEIHSYQLILAAGESARVELLANMASLNLSLLSDKNEWIAAISEVDSPNYKRLDIVAERATNYVIKVTSEYDKALAAKYQLTLFDKHAATPQDRKRFSLHILDWEVVSLYRQQEKSALQQSAEKAHAAAFRWRVFSDRQQHSLIELMLEVSVDIRKNLDPQLLARANLVGVSGRVRIKPKFEIMKTFQGHGEHFNARHGLSCGRGKADQFR